MTPEARRALAAYAASDAFGLPQMRGALAAMGEPLPDPRTWVGLEAITAAGRRAALALVESLRDWRYPPPPVQLVPEHHPWFFAMDRLARWGTPELVRLLLEAERAGRIPEVHRWVCVGRIAETGVAESVEPTLRAIGSTDRRLRDWAANGVARAARRGVLAPAMRAAMFEPILHRALNPDDWFARDAYTLLDIDRPRAVAALTTDAVLTPGHPAFTNVLRAFVFARPSAEPEPFERVAAPVERLWTLWRQVERHGFKGKEGAFASLVLAALAVSDPEGARPIAERLVDANADLERAGRTAIEIIENIDLPHHGLARLWNEKSRGTPVPRPILRVDAVRTCLFWEDVDALEELFKHGRDWRLAAEGFRAMDEPGLAAAVENAATVFGPAGPPTSVDECEAFVAALTDPQEALWRRSGDQLRAAERRLDRKIFFYMRQHRDIFSTLMPRPTVTRL